MTLEQLRIFVAVAEREHLTQGARVLNLTQSAVSSAITTLEARYATKLFDRIGRRIALTEAGRRFLVEARAILRRVADAETMLADLADMRTGSLAVAASQTIGTYWIPRVLTTFGTRFPGITVTLEIGNTEWVASRLREGAAELGFVEGPVREPSVLVEPLFDDELVVVARPDIEPPAGTPVERIRAARWVAREAGSGTRLAFEALLAAHGLGIADVAIGLELPSNEAVRSAVEAGAGLTVLSKMAVAAPLAAGSLVAVDIDVPPRGFSALRHRERHHGRAAACLVDLARGGPSAI
jgi:DNA-binding transcriptional LysR family regulator